MSVTPQEEIVRLEERIGVVLRVGILASTVCLASGLAANLWQPTVADWLLNIGIIVLIATPSARVVMSLVSFLKERDGLFAVLTAIVLVELGASVIAALIFHARI
jgi:uncharacterized membrane protein